MSASTLELILSAPLEVDGATAASGLRFAAMIANASRTLGSMTDRTRLSVVSSLSSTIDAGILSQLRRRLLSENDLFAEEMTAVLESLHLQSTGVIFPGEEMTTSARSLALHSVQSACTLGTTCGPLRVVAPPLATGSASDNQAASYTVPARSLTEIMSNIGDCASDGYGNVIAGVMSVTWSSSPHELDDTHSRLVWHESANVTSLTFSACGRTMAVHNLTVPIVVRLPVVPGSDFDEEAPEIFSGKCNDARSDLRVRCNSSGEVVNVTCPDILHSTQVSNTWNVTCPVARRALECRFWDSVELRWSTAGCTVQPNNTSRQQVVCKCDHLTGRVMPARHPAAT